MSKMTLKGQAVEVEVAVQEVGEEFWELDSSEQAEFFSALAIAVMTEPATTYWRHDGDHWEAFREQVKGIMRSSRLSPCGEQLMGQLYQALEEYYKEREGTS